MAAGVRSSLLVSWLVFIVFRQSQGLSLTVDSEECVYEEVSFDGDMISGNFVVVEQFLFWKSKSSGIDFSVFDPMGNMVKMIKESSGEKFEILASKRGNYKFCFYNHNSASETVSFYIRVGHIPQDQEFARDEHLGPLIIRIAKLKEALESAVSEQIYLKARDARHRITNESTRRRLMAYTLTEYLAFICVSGAQAYFIRRLFKRSQGYIRV